MVCKVFFINFIFFKFIGKIATDLKIATDFIMQRSITSQEQPTVTNQIAGGSVADRGSATERRSLRKGEEEEK